MTLPTRAVATALALGLGLSILGAAPATAAEDCAVTDATITWGFKETFRSYISSTIANGEWTVANGATYETPNFGWSDGVGTISGGVGSVDFTGSVEFTGHGDILDTTVANPRIVFDGSSTALIYFDVSGTTQQGAAIDEKSVEFATVDVAGAIYGEGTVSLVDAPTVLTEQGSVAFGTYEAGESFDPLTLDLTADPACTTAPAAGPHITAVVAVAVAVLVAISLLVVVMVRRRAQTPGA